MSDTQETGSETGRNPPRKLWPWVVSSVVALIAAIFLTVWVPQEQGTSLLERIKDSGGEYSIDTADRPAPETYLPEAGSMLDDIEYVDMFDQVKTLKLPRSEPKVFRDAVTKFSSLEKLEFDLANSVDFERETAARLTELEILIVNVNADCERTNYSFLTGCQKIKTLPLTGNYHDDGLWEALPVMKSLTHLDLDAGPKVRGEAIPDLAGSHLENVEIYGAGGECEFHGLGLLLTAPHLKVLYIQDTDISEQTPVQFSSPPELVRLSLLDTKATDHIFPLLQNLNSLQVLDLSGNQLAGDSLDLLSSLPLVLLNVDHNPLTAEAFRDLSQFAGLNRLNITETGVQPEWLECWRDSPLAAHLTALSLSYDALNDEVVDLLLSFPNLKYVTITLNGATDEEIREKKESDDLINRLVADPGVRRVSITGRNEHELTKRSHKLYGRMRSTDRLKPVPSSFAF